MKTQELKDVLSQRILNINDDKLLKSIKHMTDKSVGLYPLDSEERHMIEEARTEYESGEVISHEEVIAEIDT